MQKVEMGNLQKCSSNLTIYSHNVGGDEKTEEMMTLIDNEEFSFKKRFEQLIKNLSSIPETIDVIALNEIRHKENVDHVTKELQKIQFDAKFFANNDTDMSFNNVLAISKTSEWEADDNGWEKKWVSYDNGTASLKDDFVTIEGDSFGRCAGIVYLKNKKNSKKVCLLASHVCAFGDVKKKQQNALFSINPINLNKNPKIPSILVGDLNRFKDEDKDFQQRLKDYRLVEAKSNKLVIPNLKNSLGPQTFYDKNIGTFNPWPTDRKIYSKLLNEPMENSRLDVHLCSDDENLIKIKTIYTRASMLKNSNSVQKWHNIDPVRRLLNSTMTSDHLALIGVYEIM